MLDETKRALYRDMVISARGAEKTRAGFHELCAAGWMDGSTDMRMQYLSNPYFLLSINLAKGELYEVHFDLMGEQVPIVSLPIHPFDTPSVRWLSARLGTRAPVPTSVADVTTRAEPAADGAYHIVVVSDQTDTVFESGRETNNTASRGSTIDPTRSQARASIARGSIDAIAATRSCFELTEPMTAKLLSLSSAINPFTSRSNMRPSFETHESLVGCI